MTREETITKYHHQFWGIMLDVSRTGATGSARSLLEEQAMRKIDACLSSLWAEFNVVQKAEKNGLPAAKPETTGRV
jgi:hypothetical protein